MTCLTCPDHCPPLTDLPDQSDYNELPVDDPPGYTCDWELIGLTTPCPNLPEWLFEHKDQPDTDYFYLCPIHSDIYRRDAPGRE